MQSACAALRRHIENKHLIKSGLRMNTLKCGVIFAVMTAAVI
jgi:hypothetical protein